MNGEEQAQIRFDCPHCGQPLEAPVDMAGEMVQCPNDKCGEQIQIPGPVIEDKKQDFAPQLADWKVPKKSHLLMAKGLSTPRPKRKRLSLFVPILTVVCLAVGLTAFFMLHTRRSKSSLSVTRKEIPDSQEKHDQFLGKKAPPEDDFIHRLLAELQAPKPPQPEVQAASDKKYAQQVREEIIAEQPPELSREEIIFFFAEQPLSFIARPELSEQDKWRVKEAISEAISKGGVDAIYGEALKYQYGFGVSCDSNRAERLYLKAAEQGHLYSSLRLFHMLREQGRYDEAVKWLRRAADRGDASASWLLGGMYERGKGVPQDAVEAIKWYALSGTLQQTTLTGARPMPSGIDIRRMLKKADIDELLASLKGIRTWTDSKGQTIEASLVELREENHVTLRKHYDSHLENVSKVPVSSLSDADQTFVKSVKLIADELYFQGCIASEFGAKVDHHTLSDKKTISFFQGAMELGHVGAMNVLGANVFYGIEGCKQDYHKAVHYFGLAAQRGDATSFAYLGFCYGGGLGVPQDKSKAFYCWHKAAELGNVYPGIQPDLYYCLGECYHSGNGVQKDIDKARAWYQKAAAQEHAGALSALGFDVYQVSPILAADYFLRSGKAALKKGHKELALLALEELDQLGAKALGSELYALIYGKSGGVSTGEALPLASGTGWFCQGGYVVSCYHVVEGRNKLYIVSQFIPKSPVSIILKDKSNDLVLLKLETVASTLPGIPLSRELASMGEKVFTIGFPHIDLLGKLPKFTDGTISSLAGLQDEPTTYQISIPVQSGNSGGPLINERGEVVGVVVSKLDAANVFQWTGDLPQNVNYAVKAVYLRSLLDTLGSNARGGQVLPVEGAPMTDIVKRVQSSVVLVLAE